MVNQSVANTPTFQIDGNIFSQVNLPVSPEKPGTIFRVNDGEDQAFYMAPTLSDLSEETESKLIGEITRRFNAQDVSIYQRTIILNFEV